jgi:hypothetical protein
MPTRRYVLFWMGKQSFSRVEQLPLRCIKRVLYPRIVLPDGWRAAIPTEEAHWADEDLEYAEFFGIPVGELIYGP